MKNFFKNNKQTAVRGRSTAFIATVVVHVVFLILAGTYVAMEVIERREAKFEAKQIARPKMQLKKLRVPVKIQKKMARAPSLSTRMTATPKLDAKSADFKMPDMAGLGGGLGGLGGAGFGGSLGFASTQIDLFGLKSRGEKMVFLLDANGSMMTDAIGGIPAYTIIKKELLKMVETMPPTALFNVLVFNVSQCRALSPDMLPATDANLERFKKWIMPLNAQKNKYGLSTLGSPGTTIEFEPFPTVYNSRDNWVAGLGYAARKGADVVYLLGNSQDMPNIYSKYYRDAKRGEPLPYEDGWPPEIPNAITDYEPCGGRQEWNKTVVRARQLHRKFNQDRLARGKPVRVPPVKGSPDKWMVRTYLPDEPLPDIERPRQGKEHYYTAGDLEAYIGSVSRKYSSSGPAASLGLAEKTFTFNVVHFATQAQMNNPNFQLKILSDLVDKLGGEYVKIAGRTAIQ